MTKMNLAKLTLSVAYLTTPMVSFAANDLTVNIRGRLQIDAAKYFQNSTAQDFNSGSKFRRARIGVYGDITSDFSYQLLVDFADGENIKLDDSFIQYNGFDNVKITVGQHKVYHSLVSATSDIYVPFMERSMVSGFFEAGAGGKLGISVFTYGKDWTFHVGLMGDHATKVSRNTDGWGLNSRATWAPIMKDNYILHVGASAYYREESEGYVRFSDKPEIRIAGTKFINTDNIAADHYIVSGLEIATVWHGFSAQAEYNRADINLQNHANKSLWGAYASVTYFLTGEQRTYNGASGAFGRVKPNMSIKDGGYGAIGFSARYSYLDLGYDIIQNTGRKTAESFTFGVDWIPVDHIRGQLNFVHHKADNMTALSGNIIGVRFQADW
ncbi:MAG: hypothetical protein JKY45_14885 [Emcibacter sp.]|nr:hypothetical protein [Emcibacter sp.]